MDLLLVLLILALAGGLVVMIDLVSRLVGRTP